MSEQQVPPKAWSVVNLFNAVTIAAAIFTRPPPVIAPERASDDRLRPTRARINVWPSPSFQQRERLEMGRRATIDFIAIYGPNRGGDSDVSTSSIGPGCPPAQPLQRPLGGQARPMRFQSVNLLANWLAYGRRR